MANKFTRQQLLQSKQFEQSERYLLAVLLEEGKSYSVQETKALLKKEKERKVK